MKIFEALGIMTVTYWAGYIRVQTGGYIGVSALFALMAFIATAISYKYELLIFQRHNNKK
jgi:hypothetical protein